LHLLTCPLEAIPNIVDVLPVIDDELQDLHGIGFDALLVRSAIRTIWFHVW